MLRFFLLSVFQLLPYAQVLYELELDEEHCNRRSGYLVIPSELAQASLMQGMAMGQGNLVSQR